MSWRVVVRPQVEEDVIADWYETRRAGLGSEFVAEVLAVFDAIELNPS